LAEILAGLLVLLAPGVACDKGGDDDDNDTAADDDNDAADDDDNDNDDNDAADDDDDNNDDTTQAPEYPMNHAASWDCLICHATNLLGVVVKQPHGAQYDSDQCTGCHKKGDYNNPPYHGGHHWTMNCTNCHGANNHGVTFQNKDQCLVCHGPSAN
jgi:hypothetical protein